MLALHTHGSLEGALSRNVFKVLTLSEALECRYPMESVLIDLRAPPEASVSALQALGVAGVLSSSPVPGITTISALNNERVIAAGDVVRIRERGQASVLYRRGANANFLFATERCNSLCLMCSQPPRDIDDSWRVREIIETIALIDDGVAAIGVTGGEPTLLDDGLASIIEAVHLRLPDTRLNILTNARLLGDAALVDRLTQKSENVLWAIPLYGDVASQHDYVVQAPGAFEQTLNGLYNLAERKQTIEVRCVLTRTTVARLQQLAEFIWRNLPFVAHVAFMGMEPMGFAKINKDILYVDPIEYRTTLETSAWYLHDRGISTSIYNTPLCLLSPPVRKLARKSISDWKNTFPSECDSCSVKEQCSGFFTSAGSEWRSRGIQPIQGGCDER